MKLKNKALLTSALILALTIGGMNSVKASDENEMSSDVSVEENKNQENSEKLEEKKTVYSEIKLYVKNRRVKDWLKDGSYYRIEGGNSDQLDAYGNDIIKIQILDNLIPGEKQKIEILDGKEGEVYAEGEINVIADAKYGHKIDVEIIPKNPIKTRKMTLNFKDKDQKTTRYLSDIKSDKFYLFVDGKFDDEYNRDKSGNYYFKDFEYETGKKFKIEFRITRDANSELLASIEDEMPKDGVMVDSKSMNVYLKLPTDPKDDKKDSEKGSETTASSGEKEGKKTDKNSDGSKIDKPQANSKSNHNSNKNKDGKDNKKSNESNPSSDDKSTPSSNNPSNGKPKNGSNQGTSMTVTPIPGAKVDKDKISDKSFKTREETIEAAKKEMQKDTKWKSFYLIKQEDGTYKYGLSEKEDKNNPGTDNSGKNHTIKPKKITSSTKSAKKSKSPINVKTGVSGLGAIFGVLALSIIGFFATKHKK